MRKNVLSKKFPSLAQEWHPVRNGELTPDDVSFGSNMKVWWQCPHGADHEWLASPNSRSRGTGCPVCRGLKVVKSNCLESTHPQLANEWHQHRNGDLKPSTITAGSDKSVWWQCDEGHEWRTKVYDRSKGKGCPYCSGHKLAPENALSVTHPQLVDEWHPTKNGERLPEQFSKGSHQKVWWKCAKGEDHEWIASIGHRANGRGCPICNGRKVVTSNSLETLYPSLAKQWHLEKNGSLKPTNVSAQSNKKVWWRCNVAADHIWDDTIAHRTNGRGCPMCSGKRTVKSNSLATKLPELAQEWHESKNGDFTPHDVTVSSSKSVWWKCDVASDHEWKAQISQRTSGGGRGCPMCSGKRVVKSNCLKTTHPDISQEWHHSLNGDFHPTQISAGSNRLVWWACEIADDHVWRAPVSARTSGKGCPMCSGRKVVTSNCLATINSAIAQQWHKKKNGKLTPNDVVANSNKVVWWQCPEGKDHIWKASVGDRNQGKGCPVCRGLKVVDSNSLATLEPDLAKQWHPSKNGLLTPNDVTRFSHKKVWWQCEKADNHFWKAIISNRTTEGKRTGCPFCTLTPQSRQELAVLFELKWVFKEINPKGFKTRVGGKLWTIDVFIPSIQVGIEFDGAFWHKDKEALDKLKTLQLQEAGLKVLRIREAPLEKIFESDMISEVPFDARKVVEKILCFLRENYPLSVNQRNRIHSYLSASDLQNQAALDRYIDKILEEKASRLVTTS